MDLTPTVHILFRGVLTITYDYSEQRLVVLNGLGT